MPGIELIMKYEQGECTEAEIVALFQDLIDSGMAWRFQGSYGRTAAYLIRIGACQPAP